MPCLVDMIKKNTEKRVEKLRSDIEAAQEAMEERSRQMDDGNTAGIFELAEIVCSLQDAVFEMAGLLSEMKGGDGDGEALH